MCNIVKNDTVPKRGKCEAYRENYGNNWYRGMAKQKTNSIHDIRHNERGLFLLLQQQYCAFFLMQKANARISFFVLF